ncbi:MAG: acyl-CoA dehydrogenase, partial [bacterium]
MENFFTDIVDIRFHFERNVLADAATIVEGGFEHANDYDIAPENASDAVDNYRRILSAVGELAATVIAPTAAETDRVGNTLNADGTVTYAP